MMMMIEKSLDKLFMIQLTSHTKHGNQSLMRLNSLLKGFYRKIQKKECHCKRFFNIPGSSRRTKQSLLKDENQGMEQLLISSKHLL